MPIALIMPIPPSTVASTNGAPAYSINRQSHLGIAGRVNLGSFYTPAKYVEMVAEWLKKHGIDKSWTIADLSCGYGAFFELSDLQAFANCRFIGNEERDGRGGGGVGAPAWA